MFQNNPLIGGAVAGITTAAGIILTFVHHDIITGPATLLVGGFLAYVTFPRRD